MTPFAIGLGEMTTFPIVVYNKNPFKVVKF